jgi:hypothetical protein
MKTFKSKFIFIFIFLTFSTIVGLGIKYFRNREDLNNSDQIERDNEAILKLLKNSSEIQRVWFEGEESKEWKRVRDKCYKKFNWKNNFDESLLRCNPRLIECIDEFDRHPPFNLKKIKNDQRSEYISKSLTSFKNLKSNGFHFKLLNLKSKMTLDVLLSDTCNEVFLEERSYAYGPRPKPPYEDYQFDNINKKIYLDQHLVTGQEINIWIDTELKNNLKKYSEDQIFLPATGLTFKQMEEYCAFRGKQLMQAHYFDAGTFLWDEKLMRSPFFWTKSSKEKTENCQLIYSSECIKEHPLKLNFVKPTSSGLFDSQGGIFEAMKNPIEHGKNLKLSSFYFNRQSKSMGLGMLGNWDGDGFNLSHFKFEEMPEDKAIDEFKVGFRCMRESLQ